MNNEFEYKGYKLGQEIILEIKDWYDKEILKSLIIKGRIDEFRISNKKDLVWIIYETEHGHITFKNNTTLYLNSGWEDIEFINKYIKK
jgi:hypothetical protein